MQDNNMGVPGQNSGEQDNNNDVPPNPPVQNNIPSVTPPPPVQNNAPLVPPTPPVQNNAPPVSPTPPVQNDNNGVSSPSPVLDANNDGVVSPSPVQNNAPPASPPPPVQNNTPPVPSGGGHSDSKSVFIIVGIVVLLIVAVIVLAFLALAQGDGNPAPAGKGTTEADVRAAFAEVAAEEYADATRRGDSAKRITDINVVSKAMGIYYVNNKKYPAPSTSAVAYRCEAGDLSGGLKDRVDRYVDGRADIFWDDVIYGVDDPSDPQMYVLGIKGMLEGYRTMEDDLDFGSQMYGENAIALSLGGTPSVGAWDCDCGSADELDSVYCETNQPVR